MNHVARFLKVAFVFALFFFSSYAQAQYCLSRGSNFNYEWIKEVKVNNLVSTSAGAGYKLFGNPVFQLAIGANQINLAPGFYYGAYQESWNVFVDLNQDGVFGAGETLFGGSSNSPIGGTLTIPPTAKNGLTRIRVSMQYGAAPSACQSFYWGEVEDYTVNIAGASTPTPPPPTTVSTTTTIGFDKGYTSDLVLVGKYFRNGVIYNVTSFFSPSMEKTRLITMDVDIGTQIEWTAAYYLNTPAGEFLPFSCTSVVGVKCITAAGSTAQTVLFKLKETLPPPPAVIVDQTITFDNLFGGAPYKNGPTVVIDGVTFSTTGNYFYNFTGAPYTTPHLGIINATFTFPAPVLNLNFQASGQCVNCVQTVQVTANGQIIGTFTLNYNVISNVVINLPFAATSVNFNQSIKMDNLGIDYQ